MHYLTAIFVVLAAFGAHAEKLTCELKGAYIQGEMKGADSQSELKRAQIPSEWVTMVDPCLKKMKDQVNIELRAAMTYMAMGAHFARDIVNRPGFAKMFFESASEERDHALKLIDYMLMRGELTRDLDNLIVDTHPKKLTWQNGVEALKDALNLETSVTAKINDIVKACEASSTGGSDPVNDYHLVDYLTGEFLDEQYKGQRDLAGKLSTLGKMLDSHGSLGEFLFDKELLK